MPTFWELAPQILVALVMLAGAGWLFRLQVKALEKRLPAHISREVQLPDAPNPVAQGAYLGAGDTGNFDNPFAAVFKRLDEQDAKLEARDERERALMAQLATVQTEMATLSAHVGWLREELAELKRNGLRSG